MVMRKSKELSTNEQQAEVASQRRLARQKRVKAIMQILGFPSAGLGIVVTLQLFMSGDTRNALIIGALTFAVTIIAIAAKFISELYQELAELLKFERNPKRHTCIEKWLENLLLMAWKLSIA